MSKPYRFSIDIDLTVVFIVLAIVFLLNKGCGYRHELDMKNLELQKQQIKLQSLNLEDNNVYFMLGG